MSKQLDDSIAGLIELTADLVAAYVSNNPLPVAALPDLISSVHASLAGLTGPVEPPAEPRNPAVNPKKSVFPDYIVSLEDGRRFKSLRRHLGTLGMTPDQYRAKWSLPGDYPMVAPNYSATRSALAKSLGLGRKAATVTAPAKTRRTKRATEA
jgi:predicted transcriptional regulator